jgi:prolyl oligopeptidase
LTALYDYERFGCPFKRGDFWYYFYNSGLQQQNVLYRTVDLSDASKAEVFFDPNTLTADGTAALSTYSFSESGKLFAYGLSYSGSDWVEIFVKDVTTGKILSDKIKWAKFTSIAWTHDDLGFFYFRYPSPSTEIKDMGTETNTNLNGMLYYHKIGQLQDQDLLVLKDEKNPTHMFGAELSDDGEYLMVSVSESCDPVNKLYMMKIAGVSLTSSDVFKFDKIVDNFEAKYDYITNLGSVYYFKTNKNASRSKCIKIDLSSTEKVLSPFFEIISLFIRNLLMLFLNLRMSLAVSFVFTRTTWFVFI